MNNLFKKWIGFLTIHFFACYQYIMT